MDSEKTSKSIVKPQPIIKWVGGKRQLLEQFQPFFPKQFNRYFEPFVGGAAVFFSLDLEEAILMDTNAELVNLYNVIKEHVEPLIENLRHHKNEESYYYTIRALVPATLSPVERASRFIYLNKTCYNGLYRVNRQGKFNVPFGKYTNPDYVNADGLRLASAALQRATIMENDFSAVLELANPGDFVYFDPPYHPVSETSNFTSYTKDSFGVEDQRRLAAVFVELVDRGCHVMLSNSDTPFIRELYMDYRIETVRARRAVNSKADGRGYVSEVVAIGTPKLY